MPRPAGATSFRREASRSVSAEEAVSARQGLAALLRPLSSAAGSALRCPRLRIANACRHAHKNFDIGYLRLR
jgi:hypothetical protein